MRFMTIGRRNVLALVTLPALLALSGCSPTKPPLDELDAASRGLGAARTAGAENLAAADYRSAARRFDQAQAAEARGDYDDAARLARESAADSELALARTRVAKARDTVSRLQQQNAGLDRDLSEHAAPEDQP